MNNRLIVVLGMHRSGTSAITKSLELMGVGLGSDIHPAGFDNPKGFWEDQGCIEINNELLKHLGSAYDRLGLAWCVQTDSRVHELRLKAIQLISRKLIENNGIWGFKDPRTCRLLDFWDKVFSELDCDVSFVLAVRNPASVVASLLTRNSMPEEKAYFLWLQHVLPSLKSTTGTRRVVVDYDEFLANPYPQLVRMSSSLGLSIPNKENSLVVDFESNFLDRELSHTRFSENDLALDKRAPKMILNAYSLLRQLANDHLSLENSDVQTTLNELNNRLIDVSPAFDYINTLEDDRIGLWQAIAERDSQIANLNQAVSERDSQIANLTVEIKYISNSMSWKITKLLRLFKNSYKSKF